MVIIKLCARWKNPIKLAITLDPKDAKGTHNVGSNIGDNCIRAEVSFNSLITESFEGSDMENLIQNIFAQNRLQIADQW